MNRNSYIRDCCDCIHNDKLPGDEPCYHCLSGYNGRPDFRPKKKEEKEEDEKNGNPG